MAAAGKALVFRASRNRGRAAADTWSMSPYRIARLLQWIDLQWAANPEPTPRALRLEAALIRARLRLQASRVRLRARTA